MKRLALVAVAVFGMFGGVVSQAADADKALNENYRALLARLGSTDQQRLREAQRAWIAFRDKECSFRTQAAGSATLAACIVELDQQRADVLKQRLDCREGGPGCTPVAAAASSDAPCSETAGKSKADEYVQQCLQVSPATHPPCNASNACQLIVDEIERGCAMIDHDAPAFCANYAGKGSAR